MSDVTLFVATKAFIIHHGNILILRESGRYADGTNANRYDVPGGRVKPGEQFTDGLRREVKEETGLAVVIGSPFYVGEWRPVVRGQQWQVVGIFFLCHTETNQVSLSADHDDWQWIDPARATTYSLIDNLGPAFEAYCALKKQ